MKKISTFIKTSLLIITILLISFYFLIDRYQTYKLRNLNAKQYIYLNKKETQKNVVGYKIIFKGYIDGKAKIVMYNEDKIYNEKIISNKIEFSWGGDWYSNAIKLQYIPLSKIKKGNIEISYILETL